jgi:hypothetical protein
MGDEQELRERKEPNAILTGEELGGRTKLQFFNTEDAEDRFLQQNG